MTKESKKKCFSCKKLHPISFIVSKSSVNYCEICFETLFGDTIKKLTGKDITSAEAMREGKLIENKDLLNDNEQIDIIISKYYFKGLIFPDFASRQLKRFKEVYGSSDLLMILQYMIKNRVVIDTKYGIAAIEFHSIAAYASRDRANFNTLAVDILKENGKLISEEVSVSKNQMVNPWIKKRDDRLDEEIEKIKKELSGGRKDEVIKISSQYTSLF